jgi:hypothetical protein
MTSASGERQRTKHHRFEWGELVGTGEQQHRSPGTHCGRTWVRGQRVESLYHAEGARPAAPHTAR